MSYVRTQNHFMDYEAEDDFMAQMIGPYNFMYDEMSCKSYSVNNSESQQSQESAVHLDREIVPIN